MQRLLFDTWLLLTLRWQLSWNTFRARRRRSQVAIAVASVLAAVAVGLVASLLGEFLGRVVALAGRRALVDQELVDQEVLAGLIPGLLLSVAGLLILLNSVGLTLSTLFLASDLERLMAAPVDRRAVFVSKILAGMGWYYAIMACVALPALYRYGGALGYGLPYYLLATIAVAGTPLLPAGLGAVLVMLVARFAPARRMREVLGLLAALFGISCSLVGQTTRFWGARLREIDASPQQLIEALRSVAALPVPTLFAGRGLVAAGSGDWPSALRDLAGFYLLTFGLFGACVWVADALYATGWVRLQGSGSARRRPGRRQPAAGNAGWLGRAPASVAVALKDWRVIPRDLRNLAQLLSPLIILPAVYLNLLAGSGRRRPGPLTGMQGLLPGVVEVEGILVAIGILTICSLVLGQIAITSIGREGRSWPLLKVAPVSELELLTGKLIAVAIPFALLSTVLMAGAAVWLGLSPLGALYGWYGVEITGIGMLAIGVALSVPWARLDWDDPRKMSSGWATFLFFLGGWLFALVTGMLLCLPVVMKAILPALAPAAWVFALGASLATSAGVTALALRLGSNRLPAVGETG